MPRAPAAPPPPPPIPRASAASTGCGAGGSRASARSSSPPYHRNSLNFGKFEILADLGQGAMRKVYRAHDPILDRPVALKTVTPALVSSKDTLARFRRETRAGAPPPPPPTP